MYSPIYLTKKPIISADQNIHRLNQRSRPVTRPGFCLGGCGELIIMVDPWKLKKFPLFSRPVRPVYLITFGFPAAAPGLIFIGHD